MAEVIVRNNTLRLYTIADVRLMPGVNIVTEAQCAALKAHPIFAHKVENDLMEVEEESGGTSAKELVALMPEIFDVARLRELADDPRKSVAAAARKQLDAIDEATKREANQE